MTGAEKQYLNYLANIVADMNLREKEYLWNKVAEKSVEEFETIPLPTPPSK